MKKYIFLLFLSFSFFSNNLTALAVEGTCSSHGGINCKVGSDWDGSVICNDWWAESTERYSDQIMCQTQVKTPCTTAEYNTIKSKYNPEVEQLSLDSLKPEFDSLVQSSLHPDPSESASSLREKALKSLELQTKISNLQSELQYKFYQIDKECQALGAVTYQRQQQEFLKSLTQTQSAPLPTVSQPKPVILDTGPKLTNDERCVSLKLGTWYNTEKQNCDICPVNTERVLGTNICKTRATEQITKKEPIKTLPSKITPQQKNTIEKLPQKEVFVQADTQSSTTIKESTTTNNIVTKVVKKENFLMRIWRKVFNWF